MGALLIQSTTGSIQFYIETTGGSPATTLETTDVQVDIKKSTDSFFSNKVLTADTLATADIGSGVNGVVTVAVPGTAGNSYTVEVVVPLGTTSLAVTKTGTVLEVSLATVGGVPSAANTALAVAAAIEALDSEIQATYSGTGAGLLSLAEGPTALTGGADGDFTNLGAGYYELDLDTDDTDTLGVLTVRIMGSTIRSTLRDATVVVATPASPTPSWVVPTTIMYGYVLSATGSAVPNAAVAVRVLSTPTVLHSGSEGLVISTGLVSTVTDSTGYFSLSLVAGSLVDVFIPSANYRRTFTVPSTSTNLFDLP